MKAHYTNGALIVGSYQTTVCTSQAMFERELKDMNWPRDDWPYWLKTEHANACCHAFHDKGICIVCVPPAPDRDQVEVAGLLIHEAVHVWQHECNAIGEDSPSKEFEAYSIQRIAQGLLAEYRRQVYR